MRTRIICLLIILLFALVGALSCSQRLPIGAGDKAMLSHQAVPHDEAADFYLIHALLASRLTDEVRPDTKYSLRNPVLPGFCLVVTPTALVILDDVPADLHPNLVGYYVFSLEKIPI